MLQTWYILSMKKMHSAKGVLRFSHLILMTTRKSVQLLPLFEMKTLDSTRPTPCHTLVSKEVELKP